MKLIRRFIGAMLAVSLGLGVQVFGPTLLPNLATDASAADLLPALVPALSLAGYAGDDGFVVTVSNYDPTFGWDVIQSQGVISVRLPTNGSPFLVTVRGLQPASSSTITVTAWQPGYADGTASIVGYSRTPVAVIPAPAATSNPAPTPPPIPTSAPAPTETTIPNPPTVSPPAPQTIDPAAELALAEQRAKEMQQALADDELKTNADVIALTQRITDAITNQNRTEDRRLMANAKALARLASNTRPNARAKLGRLSLLTAQVRRTLRN